MKIKSILFGLIISALCVSGFLGFGINNNITALADSPYPEIFDFEVEAINTTDTNADGFLNGLDAINETFVIETESGDSMLDAVRNVGNAADFVLTDALGNVLPYTPAIENPYGEYGFMFPQYNIEVRTLNLPVMGATVKYYPYLGRITISSPYALSVPVELYFVVRVSSDSTATFDSTTTVPMGSLDGYGNNFPVDEILYKENNEPAKISVFMWNEIFDLNYNYLIDFGDAKNTAYFKGMLNYPIVIDNVTYTQSDVEIFLDESVYDEEAHQILFYVPNSQLSLTYKLMGYTGAMPSSVLYFSIGDNYSPSLDVVVYNESLQQWEIASTAQATPYTVSNRSYDDGGAVVIFFASNHLEINSFVRSKGNFNVEVNFDELNETKYIETTVIDGNFYFIYSATLTPCSEAGINTLPEELNITYFLRNSPKVYISVEYYTSVQPKIIMRNNQTSFEVIKGTSLTSILAIIESSIYSVEDMGQERSYAIEKHSNPATILMPDYNLNAYGTYSGTITWTGSASHNTCVLDISVVISNHAPTISFSSATASNSSVSAGTVISGSFVVSDLDGDTTEIFASINVEAESATLVVLGTNWILTPTAKFLGSIVISAYAVDSEGLQGVANPFTVTFIDTVTPSIVFNIASMNSGTLTIFKSQTPTNLRSFIESVSDDISNPSVGDVTIDGGDTRTFNTSGNFSIVYRLPDGNGNTAIKTIAVTVENVIPVINDISKTLSYRGSHIITLEEFDSDGDALLYNIVSSTWFVDDEGHEYSGAPIVPNVTGNVITIEIAPSTKNILPAVVIFNYEVSDGEVPMAMRPRAKITLTFVDDIKPIITTNNLPTQFNKGEAPAEFDPVLYFSATDEIDGVIMVTDGNITGSVNFDVVGTYTLTCAVQDVAGNISTKSVDITIKGTGGTGDGDGDGDGDGEGNGMLIYIILGSAAGGLVVAGVVILIIRLVRKSRMRV